MSSDTGLSVVGMVCAGIILVILILPTFLLSRLFKLEHDEFHDQWEKGGRPSGMPFWFPAQEIHLMSLRSYYTFAGLLWLFKTPAWVKGHAAATRLLRYYRFASYAIYLACLGACLLAFLSGG